jgi:hypothetical protein
MKSDGIIRYDCHHCGNTTCTCPSRSTFDTTKLLIFRCTQCPMTTFYSMNDYNMHREMFHQRSESFTREGYDA